jgi:hypothetical protein
MFSALTFVLFAPALGQPPALVAEARPVRHVVCVLEFELRFSPAYQLNELSVVAAAAPELSHHQIKVRTKMLAPAGELAKEPEWPFRPFVTARLRPAATQRTFPVKIQYEATLLERRLVPAAGRKPAPLDEKTRAAYLAPTEWYDFKTPAFARWLDQTGLRREEREAPLAFARRAFLTLGQKFGYKSGTAGRPASQVIALTEADCDTLSFVYIAALRANGVPARLLLGRSTAKSVQAGEPARLPGHAVVEFYADDVGWVYCDPAGGVKRARTRPLVDFGQSKGHFLVLQVEPGMRVPGAKAETVRTVRSLTSPAYANRGKGKSESKMTPVAWTVTVGP